MKLFKKLDTFLDILSVLATFKKYSTISQERFLTDEELTAAFDKASKAYKKITPFYLQAVKTNNVEDQTRSFPLFCYANLLSISVFQQKGAFKESNQVCHFLLQYLTNPTHQGLRNSLEAQVVINDFRGTIEKIEKEKNQWEAQKTASSNKYELSIEHKEDLEVFRVQFQNFYKSLQSVNILGELALLHLIAGNKEEAQKAIGELMRKTPEPSQQIKALQGELFQNAGLYLIAPHIGHEYRQLIENNIRQIAPVSQSSA